MLDLTGDGVAGKEHASQPDLVESNQHDKEYNVSGEGRAEETEESQAPMRPSKRA